MKSRFFKFFFFGLFALAAISLIVMLLWNWLMPAIFGLTAISFCQALGLFVLGRILLGSFGLGRHGHGRFGHKGNHLHKKWGEMTEEQRKEFIERRLRFGFGRHFGGETADEGSGKEE